MRVSRFVGVCLPCLILVTTCGGDRAKVSTSPSAVGNTPVLQLRIVGIPVSFSPGGTAQLTAEVHAASTGQARACDATWSVDDGSVATISPSGVLTAKAPGYTTVRAACDAATATIEARIDAKNPYRLVINTVDSQIGCGASGAVMEFLDGPRAGEKVCCPYRREGIPDVPWPVKVRFSSPDFESVDFVLAPWTGEPEELDECDEPWLEDEICNRYGFTIPMTFKANASTDTYLAEMDLAREPEANYPFVLRTPGEVKIRTWWGLDYNDYSRVELWCGDRLLAREVQQMGSNGDGITHSVTTPGACKARFLSSNDHGYDSMKYRLTIQYPR